LKSAAEIHEEKYRLAKAAGEPGWGGSLRIANLPRILEERFLNSSFTPQTGRALELGCGAGQVSIELARKGFDVYGVDFSSTAVAWAQENAKTQNVTVQFSIGNVTRLDTFPNNFFDLITLNIHLRKP
jgi:ubiquinone/menaquinone biosynthesis C-methylase UbiE